MDKFTETSYTSYGQNIGNSFKGIFVGLILLIGSIILLWWNEGRSVAQATALEEMQKNIVTLPDTRYDAKNDGKAVLLQGSVKPLSELVDPEFAVKSDGLILHKNVSMYQWKENTESKSQDKLGGGTETVTTYTYVKEWSSFSNNSADFKHPEGHQNPLMTRHGETFTTDAQLGDFHLEKYVVSQISTSLPYNGLAGMPDNLGVAKNYKTFLYLGLDPKQPNIGDIKITYTYAPAGVYTFAAKQISKALAPYTTENGKEFIFARQGRVSAQTIFKEELDANSLLTWILRGVGLFLMFISFTLILGPLATFAKVIPMLGSLVGSVTGIAAAVLTLLLGSVIIALAWFSARPLMSLSIILVGVGIAFALGKIGKKKESITSQTTPPPSSPPKREYTRNTPPSREQKSTDEEEERPSSSATPPPRASK